MQLTLRGQSERGGQTDLRCLGARRVGKESEGAGDQAGKRCCAKQTVLPRYAHY